MAYEQLIHICSDLLNSSRTVPLCDLGKQIIILSQTINSLSQTHNARRVEEDVAQNLLNQGTLSSIDVRQVPDYKKDIISLNDVSIPVFKEIKCSVVDEPTDVPNAKLYYIKEFKQYGIRINGHLLHGDIGIIGNKEYLMCKHGNGCHIVLEGRICPRYHNVRDLVKLRSQLSQENYQKIIDHYRIPYFHRTSFQTATKRDGKIKHQIKQRQIGNRSTLYYDLERECDFDIDYRPLQLAHDMLIWLILTELKK